MTDTRYAAGNPVDFSWLQPLPVPPDAKATCYVTPYGALNDPCDRGIGGCRRPDWRAVTARATRDVELNGEYRTNGATT